MNLTARNVTVDASTPLAHLTDLYAVIFCP